MSHDSIGTNTKIDVNIGDLILPRKEGGTENNINWPLFLTYLENLNRPPESHTIINVRLNFTDIKIIHYLIAKNRE